MINLAKLTEQKKDDKLRVLGIGPTGIGKTIAFSSWPGKTIIFDFEYRYVPILDWFKDRLSDFDVILVTPEDYFSVFQKKVNELADNNPYQNIIIDSITSLSVTTVMMQMLAKGAIQHKINDKGAKQAGIKLNAGGISIPGWDEINGEAQCIHTLFECLKSFDCNLFVNAHPIDRQKDGQEYSSLVTFGPKVESMIPTYFNEIWYFEWAVPQLGSTGAMNRQVVTIPTPRYKMARTAIKGFPEKINITGKNLYDEVKKYL